LKSRKTSYPLTQVKTLARADSDFVQINQNAKDSALSDFGFRHVDILNTIKKLSGNDFYKSEPSKKLPDISIDVYKTQYLNEEIYLHLYIKNINGRGILVINSFKQQ
jgi:hypothetical protein